MKTLRRNSGYAHTKHVVLLAPHEYEYSNRVLLVMADNGAHTLTPENAAEIDACVGERHPLEHHFGGTVEKRRGRKNPNNIYALIKVYTD